MVFEGVDKYLKTIEAIIMRLDLPVRKECIGMSAQGRTIIAYSLSDLPNNLLVLGFPHPNEPLSQIVIKRLLVRAAELIGTGNDTWWWCQSGILTGPA